MQPDVHPAIRPVRLSPRLETRLGKQRLTYRLEPAPLDGSEYFGDPACQAFVRKSQGWGNCFGCHRWRGREGRPSAVVAGFRAAAHDAAIRGVRLLAYPARPWRMVCWRLRLSGELLGNQSVNHDQYHTQPKREPAGVTQPRRDCSEDRACFQQGRHQQQHQTARHQP